MSNLIRRLLERRSLAAPSPEMLALFTSGPTESGAVVTPLSALSVPAVFACCQVLSQDVARTPIRFRQETAPDTFQDATAHPLYEILSSLPNPEMTAYQFKAAMQWQLLMFGKAFAEIVRVDGRVTALWPLASEYMRVDRDEQRRKRWTYGASGSPIVWTFDASAPPIFELVSETPLIRCKELIGTAIAVQQFSAKFFANGAKPSGLLQTPAGMTDEQVSRMRDIWTGGYSGSVNRGKVPVLTGDVKFTAISESNEDSQLNETTRSINEQIAGVFRIPPWKIGDLSKANYSNMESGELSYITDSLDPWFELWEETLRRDLLTTRQYGQFTVSFDRQALVRNDVKSLNASLSSGIQNGYLSQNEARKAIGLNPIPDGDKYMVNSALQPIGEPKEVPVVA